MSTCKKVDSIKTKDKNIEEKCAYKNKWSIWDFNFFLVCYAEITFEALNRSMDFGQIYF